MPPPFDLAELNAMDRAGFAAALGSSFEHAAWVAESAWAQRPFASVAQLHTTMLAVVRAAPEERQLAFLCGHPELAGREAQAGTMTCESVGEQGSAGLDALSRAELLEIQRLNQAYRARHGFPFIIAVRRSSRQQIFAALRARTEAPTAVERQEALAQIGLITRGRLDALVVQSEEVAP